jgi:hypothetical protein
MALKPLRDAVPMPPRALSLLLAASALLAPLALGDDAARFAPLGVLAVDASPTLALVTWAPGEVPADSYRVYGLDGDGSPVLLLDAEGTTTTAAVPGGFERYGVSGVVNGEVSPLVLSLVSINEPDCLIEVSAYPYPYVSLCKLPVSVEDLPLP